MGLKMGNIDEYNLTRVKYPSHKSVAEIFEEQVQRLPKKVALSYEDENLTYQELNDAINNLANVLSEKGIIKGQVVGLLTDRSFEMIIGIFALIKIGAVYLPIDPTNPQQRITYILRDSNATALLITNTNKHVIPPEFSGLVHEIKINKNNNDENPNVEISPKDPFHIIYTSGSTGNPKGVVISNKNIIKMVKNNGYIEISDCDNILQLSNYAFDGSTFEIFHALLNGAKLVLISKDKIMDINCMADIIRKQNITFSFMTVPFFNAIVEENLSCLDNVKKICFGGEQASYNHVKKALDYLGEDRLINGYGPSEGTCISTSYLVNNSLENLNRVPIGRPVNNTIVYCLNENKEPQPIGVPGELYIGGDGIALGYLNRPKLNEEKFVENPFIIGEKMYKTGDLVYWNTEGQLEFLERIDEQIKIHGYRVEIGEIEHQILCHSMVKDVVVTAFEHSPGIKSLCAYVVLRENIDLSVIDFRKFLQNSLPDYMIPTYFMDIEKLPLTSNGKIDRKNLPKPILRKILSEVEIPQNKLEEKICLIWEDLLKVKGIGINDSFLDLGGNSIFVFRFISRMKKELGIVLNMDTTFLLPTIKKLTEYISLNRKSLNKEESFIEPSGKGTKGILSASQKRLWFLNELEGDSPLYNVPNYIEINGELDINRFEKSLNLLLKQQDILRSKFINKDGVPHQKQSLTAIERLSVIDVEKRKSEQILDLLQFEAKKGFDISEKLYDFKLYKISETSFIFYFNLHHIIFDGWSCSVFVEELLKNYEAMEKKREPKGENNFNYNDYIDYQEKFLLSSEATEQLGYWKNKLSKTAKQTRLVPGSQVSEVTNEGDEWEFELDIGLIEQLKKFTESNHATLSMGLMSIFKIFIYRLSQQNDISVGMPVFGRKNVDFEKLIGMFVNTVVIRDKLDKSITFKDLLKQIKTTTIEALSNDEIPFEKVVEEIKPERFQQNSPFFQYMFAFQDIPINIENKNLQMKVSKVKSIHTGTAKFDLTLYIERKDAKLVGRWEYRKSLFNKQTIERFSRIFINLMKSALENPDFVIDHLSLLSTKEQRNIIYDLNDTQVEFPKVCLHELFEQQVLKTPNHIAAIYEGKTITYKELEYKSNQVANMLINKGVQKNSTIGVQIPRSLNLVIALLGILKAGGAYVPLDTELPPNRVKLILKDAQSSIIFTESYDNHFDNDIEAISLLKMKQDINRYSYHKPDIEISPDQLVSIYYTSGSTGNPKGVCNTHVGWVNRMCWMQNKHNLKENETVLQKTTLTFDDAAVEFFWPLMVGGSIALIPPGEHKDPVSIIQYAIDYKVSLLQFVPSMLQMVVDTITVSQREELNKLRIVVSSGEALTNDLVQNFYRKMPGKLFNSWGATEASIDSTCYDCPSISEEIQTEIVSVGKPIDNNRIYVLDNRYQPLPVGVPGDLFISGIGLATGYLNNPEKTLNSFIDDPFYPQEKMYKTGDRGYLDENGNIMFLGREDNQVKIRGMRVELGEIESSIKNIKAIKDAIVLKRMETLIAYYIIDNNQSSLNQIEINEELKRTLPEYMVPTHYIEMVSFPFNQNGKVDRKALPIPTEDNLIKNELFIEPKNKLENEILQVWKSRLNLNKIGTHDSFFELGGHSLLAVQIVAEMNRKFNSRLKVKTLFENPTIVSIARLIEEQEKNSSEYHQIEKKSIEGELYELSDAQKRIYFLDKLNTNNLYNVPLILKCNLPIDQSTLEKNLNRLLKRHYSLRTVFIENKGIPKQQVKKSSYEMDLRNTTVNSEDIHTLIQKELSYKFKIEDEPLIRGLLVKTPKHDILILTFHHIVCDGWSLKIFKEELSQLCIEDYKFLQKEPVQYIDYTLWQKNNTTLLLEKQLLYWKNQLRNFQPNVHLPLENINRGTESVEENTIVKSALSESTSQKLRMICKKLKVTPFMILLGYFSISLSKMSNQKDVILGTPLINRNREELENAFGLYLNTLPIRTYVNDHLSFEEYMLNVKTTIVDLFENQDVPFEKLVEELQLERKLNRNPIFDVLINFRKFDKHNDINMSLFDEIEVDNIPSKFFMTLYIEECEKEYIFKLAYRNDLYSNERMKEFLNQYKSFIENYIENPLITIEKMLAVTDYSKKILPNPTSTIQKKTYPSVIEEIDRWAKKLPEKTAIEAGLIKLSYKELSLMIKNRAADLIQLGIKSDEIVGIYGSKNINTIVSICAVLKIGATFVNLDDSIPPKRLEKMLQKIEIETILKAADIPTANHNVFKSLNIKKIYNVEMEKANKHFKQENEMHLSKQTENAYIFFTSGTTGLPKPILGTHNGLSQFIDWQKKEFDVGVQDRSAQLTNITFDVYLRDIFLPLTSGATLCIPNNQEDIIDWLHKNEITLLHGVPSLTKYWLSNTSCKEHLGKLRHIFFAGEPLTKKLVDMVRLITSAQINNFYGQTESTLAKSFYQVSTTEVNDVMPIGFPINDAQLLILTPSDEMCGIGEAGSIHIRSPYMTKGYIGEGETFKVNPYTNNPEDLIYKTGDLGRYRIDGSVEILGRMDDQVKINGVRINKNEISISLLKENEIAECVVIDTIYNGKKTLFAFLVLKENEVLDTDLLRIKLKNELLSIMIPSRFFILEKLPITKNGKIDKEKLLDITRKQTLLKKKAISFETELELSLKAIWEEVIGVNAISPEDNFFELGGHSLLILKLIVQIKKKLHQDVNVIDIFKYPTIKTLAVYMSQKNRDVKALKEVRKVKRIIQTE
ncbi:amino acid adenylation domain-containing protein [Lysinibacillus sp. JNUCC 51]|uniref:amino acid adenylation domain-containing protein n=1 Tax=Lysinibacillus sp. JNUCC-51 TaxID=2792479 RepID=UPI001935DCC3|nr:amino acid adenylation domain-containing protein [Lysinibacillus sp. JNUCC-51]